MCVNSKCKCKDVYLAPISTWTKINEGDTLRIRHEKYGTIMNLVVTNGHNVKLAANRWYLRVPDGMVFGTSEQFENMGWVIDSLVSPPRNPFADVPSNTVIGLNGSRWYPFVVAGDGKLTSVVSGHRYTWEEAVAVHSREFVILSRPVIC